jgi:hypothetical protein
MNEEERKALMAEYGEACVRLEIAQNAHAQVKARVVEFLNARPVEQKAEE